MVDESKFSPIRNICHCNGKVVVLQILPTSLGRFAKEWPRLSRVVLQGQSHFIKSYPDPKILTVCDMSSGSEHLLFYLQRRQGK